MPLPATYFRGCLVISRRSLCGLPDRPRVGRCRSTVVSFGSAATIRTSRRCSPRPRWCINDRAAQTSRLDGSTACQCSATLPSACGRGSAGMLFDCDEDSLAWPQLLAAIDNRCGLFIGPTEFSCGPPHADRVSEARSEDLSTMATAAGDSTCRDPAETRPANSPKNPGVSWCCIRKP